MKNCQAIHVNICLFMLASAFILASCAGQDADQAARSGIQRSTIQGIWWSPEMYQSAAFQINDSTIYYPDDFKEYRYSLSADTILIYRDDGSIFRSVILRATPDTLILVTEGIEEIYTRAETPVP